MGLGLLGPVRLDIQVQHLTDVTSIPREDSSTGT